MGNTTIAVIKRDGAVMPVKLWNDITDQHRGETFGHIYADGLDDERVGSIDYSEWQGSLHIKMISVVPSYQRQGVATAMLDYLRQEWPGKALAWGGATPEGEALRCSYAAPGNTPAPTEDQ